MGGIGRELGTLGVVFTIYVMGLLLLGTAILALLFIRSPAHRVPVALILLGRIGVRIAYDRVPSATRMPRVPSSVS